MDMEAVAKRIREARVAQHLTQEDLAAKAEISLTHMGVMCRGSWIVHLFRYSLYMREYRMQFQPKFVEKSHGVFVRL